MSAFANAPPDSTSAPDFNALAQQVKDWGRALGFQKVGISTLAVDTDADQLDAWLAAGFHGEMDYMARNTDLRRHPERLVPGAIRAICVRMDYRPIAEYPDHVLNQPALGYVARYALGRDYHKVLRKRLEQLARRIADAVGPPRLSRVHRQRARPGKSACSPGRAGLDRQAHQSARPTGGVVVFSSARFSPTCRYRRTNRSPPIAAVAGPASTSAPPRPSSRPIGSTHGCASATSPSNTKAPFPKPFDPSWAIASMAVMTANWSVRGTATPTCRRRRILRPATRWMPHGCWICLPGTSARLKRIWPAPPIRRIGHARWLRNVAVALGNASFSPAITSALESRVDHPDALVREHVGWALARQRARAAFSSPASQTEGYA